MTKEFIELETITQSQYDAIEVEECLQYPGGVVTPVRFLVKLYGKHCCVGLHLVASPRQNNSDLCFAIPIPAAKVIADHLYQKYNEYINSGERKSNS